APAIPSRQGLVRVTAPPLPTGPARQQTLYGVVHMTAGESAASSIAWLRKIGLSYHYIIDRDGTIHRAADPARIAYHAGVSAWGDSLVRFGRSLNPVSVGVALAHRNDDSEPVTSAAYHSLVWVAAILSESNGMFAADWLGHLEVSPGR